MIKYTPAPGQINSLGRRWHQPAPRPKAWRPDSASTTEAATSPRREMPSDRYPIAFAMANAAAAASPPTSAVCQALLNGFFTVNRPFT